jgi:phosphotransferase system HPr (HPr) family protein
MMEQIILDVTNPHGLHARPAAVFVQTASKFKSSILLRNLSRAGNEVNAKSILDVLTAGVDQGAQIELVAEGDDAQEAVRALTELVQSGLTDS